LKKSVTTILTTLLCILAVCYRTYGYSGNPLKMSEEVFVKYTINKRIYNTNDINSIKVLNAMIDNNLIRSKYGIDQDMYSYNDLKIYLPEWVCPDIPLFPTLQKYTYEVCKEYDIDYKTIIGVMATESNFNINNVSVNKDSNGNIVSRDEGLMQINSLYVYWYAELAGLEKYNTLNPYDSIKMGVAGLVFYRDYWINESINKSDLTTYMLNSYNMGIQGYRDFLTKNSNINRNYDRAVILNQERAGR
jgi:hypothetical protein